MTLHCAIYSENSSQPAQLITAVENLIIEAEKGDTSSTLSLSVSLSLRESSVYIRAEDQEGFVYILLGIGRPPLPRRARSIFGFFFVCIM